MMSSTTSQGSSAPCRSIFVYGTLRPDCPVEAAWKRPFLTGAQSVHKARIPRNAAELCLLGPYAALILYDNEHGDDKSQTIQACIAATDQQEHDAVVGYVVMFDEETWEKKLRYADEVEGYPDMYGRRLIDVEIETQDKNGAPPTKVQAYAYHRTDDIYQVLAESSKQQPNDDKLRKELTEDDEEYWNIFVRLPHGDWNRYVVESGRDKKRLEADDCDTAPL